MSMRALWFMLFVLAPLATLAGYGSTYGIGSAGGGVTVGNAVSGGTTSRLLFNDASGLVSTASPALGAGLTLTGALSGTSSNWTGQAVFDGTSGDILCDVSTGSGEPFTVCPASGQYSSVTATAVASTAEVIQSWGVSDVAGLCTLTNFTTGDARFTPLLACYNNQNASDAFVIGSLVNSTYDTGTAPAMAFRAAAGSANATPSGALTTRPLFAWQNHTTTRMDLTAAGTLRPLFYGSQGNCSDGAGAAACSSHPAGSVVIDAGATTVVVSTTAVTANSQIFVQEDSSLGTKLSATCNTTTGRTYTVSARTAATSFTITASAAPVTNPACLSYFVVN